MADEEISQPIIIKKKKGGHAGHHGGSWKVAFADFVTSMMAFFLVMWLVVQSDAVKEHVAGYFQDPQGYSKGGYKSILPGKGNTVIDMNYKNSVTPEITRKRREKEVRRQLKKAAKEIVEKLKGLPNFASLKDQIEVQMTNEGLRIQLSESKGQAFFDKGSAELLPKTKSLLKVIASEAGKLSNKIILEGHTDNLQYADNATYANWELSADRANSARRFMEKSGLRSDQVIEVRGYADRQPKVKDNPADAHNRRITIIMVNEFSGLTFLDKNAVLSGKEEKADSSKHSSTPTEIEKKRSQAPKIPSDKLPPGLSKQRNHAKKELAEISEH